MRAPVLLLLPLLAGFAAADEAKPGRTLADFVAISEANTKRASVAELTRLHPQRDWPLSLWVKRAHEAREANPSDAPLFLNGVKKLTVDEAKALAAFKGNKLFLPDVGTLAPDVAEALGATNKSLYLDGLKKIDVPIARALARSKGDRISLRGLTTLGPRPAKRLSMFDGGILLDGVASMQDTAVLLLLTHWDGWGEQVVLSLGLTSLNIEQAQLLTACGGWGLALDRIETLTPEAAKKLAALDMPHLSLGGLTSISLETAKVIATWEQKFLVLDGVKTVSPEVRKLVEKGCEAVSWRGLAKAK
ncbi:MAG: hypothetical protein QNJ98_14420 [Planctomycetota bacterium]|nr:hypothetical protein [Planctomycetota bacterium]